MVKTLNKLYKPITIGLWKSSSEWQFVWFNQDKKVFSQQFVDLDLNHLLEAVSESVESYTDLDECHFVTAILPHHLWIKTLILPQSMTADEVEQQCRYLLQNEIPVPLEDIWFDFLLTKLPLGVRIDIFVILKKVACDYVETLDPVKINILDSATNALQYAWNYLLEQNGFTPDTDYLLLYQDEDQCIALMEQVQRTLVLEQKSFNLNQLHQDFCKKYDVQPKKIFFYQKVLSDEQIPSDWIQISTTLPLIALGNALWKRPDYLQ